MKEYNSVLKSRNKMKNKLQAEKILPLIQPELEAGDAMFFHSNILHRSEVNDSDRRRWGLAMAYNRKSNNPVTAHHHPFYSPIAKASLL